MAIFTKFKALVHYVCSRRNNAPDTLGAVKLNKVLWMSDMAAFYETGHPITESRYIKRQFGPVPARILPILGELQQEGILTVKDFPHYGKQKKQYVVHKPASDSFLSPEEKAIVERMIDFVCDEHTAASVSDLSHDHIWENAADGEELPLFTVFAKPGTITNAERLWAQTQLESEAA